MFKGNKEGIYVNEPLTKNILKFTLSAEKKKGKKNTQHLDK